MGFIHANFGQKIESYVTFNWPLNVIQGQRSYMTSYTYVVHRSISHSMHHFCDIRPNISKVHIDLSDLENDLQNALIGFEDSIKTTKKSYMMQ